MNNVHDYEVDADDDDSDDFKHDYLRWRWK